MITNKNVYKPQNLDELDAIAGAVDEKLTFVAGATDLMIQQAKWHSVHNLVDLTAVDTLNNRIDWKQKGVLIGAAVPLTDLICNKKMKDDFPILIEACKQIGSVQIQNRATLGGNIANASPAGDTLPVLSVLDAQIWIGPRRDKQFEKMKLDQVMLGPAETGLNSNKYIGFVYLPYPDNKNFYWYFRKVGQRYSMAISKVSLAVLVWIANGVIEDIRITAGSVTPQILRAVGTEQLLCGQILDDPLIAQAGEQLQVEINPITDIRSTSAYRRSICGALLREALYWCKSDGSK